MDVFFWPYLSILTSFVSFVSRTLRYKYDSKSLLCLPPTEWATINSWSQICIAGNERKDVEIERLRGVWSGLTSWMVTVWYSESMQWMGLDCCMAAIELLVKVQPLRTNPLDLYFLPICRTNLACLPFRPQWALTSSQKDMEGFRRIVVTTKISNFASTLI